MASNRGGFETFLWVLLVAVGVLGVGAAVSILVGAARPTLWLTVVAMALVAVSVILSIRTVRRKRR